MNLYGTSAEHIDDIEYDGNEQRFCETVARRYVELRSEVTRLRAMIPAGTAAAYEEERAAFAAMRVELAQTRAIVGTLEAIEQRHRDALPPMDVRFPRECGCDVCLAIDEALGAAVLPGAAP